MASRKYLQHFRSSGTTQPDATGMKYGEIAIGYKKFHEKLYIKNDINTITEFSSDEQLKEIMDTQDIRVAEAAGLGVNTVPESGDVSYVYQPGSTVLNNFTDMSAAVDYLADQLQGAYDIINELKSNIYVIDTNFDVEPNSNFTQYNVSYSCMYNDNPTIPSGCTITKYVNDGSGTVILNNTGVSSATTTTNITGNKEHYVLEVVPDLAGALNTKSEVTRYLCYVGATSATTMTAQIADTFNKYVIDGDKFVAQENSNNGDYMWIIVPSFISVQFATSSGITFSLDTEIQTISNTLGSFKCYRSYKALDTASWTIVVHNIME